MVLDLLHLPHWVAWLITFAAMLAPVDLRRANAAMRRIEQESETAKWQSSPKTTSGAPKKR